MFVLKTILFSQECKENREPTSGLEPLTPAPATSDHSGVAGGCTGLQIPPNQANLFSLVCPVLHRIAFPVVSEWYQFHPYSRRTPSSTGGQPDSICGRRRASASIDSTLRLSSARLGSYGVLPVVLSSMSTSSRLTTSSTVSVSSTTRAELRLLDSGWRFESVHRGLRLRRGSAGYS
jgi:hypothetical protein